MGYAVENCSTPKHLAERGDAARQSEEGIMVFSGGNRDMLALDVVTKSTNSGRLVDDGESSVSSNDRHKCAKPSLRGESEAVGVGLCTQNRTYGGPN